MIRGKGTSGTGIVRVKGIRIGLGVGFRKGSGLRGLAFRVSGLQA